MIEPLADNKAVEKFECCFATDGTGKRVKQRKHRALNDKLMRTQFSAMTQFLLK